MSNVKIVTLSVLAVFIVFVHWGTQAADTLAGPIPARVIRVVDGDTLDVHVRAWIDTEVTTLVRILGVDTPELSGKCASEIEKARKATDYVRGLAPVGSMVYLQKIKPDKYAGRVDATVINAHGIDLATMLITEGHARPYTGGKRPGWCAP